MKSLSSGQGHWDSGRWLTLPGRLELWFSGIHFLYYLPGFALWNTLHCGLWFFLWVPLKLLYYSLFSLLFSNPHPSLKIQVIPPTTLTCQDFFLFWILILLSTKVEIVCWPMTSFFFEKILVYFWLRWVLVVAHELFFFFFFVCFSLSFFLILFYF